MSHQSYNADGTPAGVCMCGMVRDHYVGDEHVVVRGALSRDLRPGADPDRPVPLPPRSTP